MLFSARKNVLLTTLIALSLHACGANNTSLNQDTYFPPGNNSFSPDPIISPTSTISTPTPTPISGSVVQGRILDTAGKAIAGANISVSGQSTVSDDTGAYQLAGINQTEVWIAITKIGYQSLSNQKITFSSSQPSQVKDFTLKLLTETSSTPSPSPSSELTLKLENSLGSKKFRSVSAMIVSGSQVHVLGLMDGFLWMDQTGIITMGTNTGNEIVRFNKTGTFSRLSKTVDTLRFENNQVQASDGEFSFNFNTNGTFISKSSGARYAPVKEIKDDSRNITYRLKDSKTIEVVKGDNTYKYEPSALGSGKSIGLDDTGRLCILDDAQKLVHRYKWTGF
jgi:hypothetical protein